MTGYVTNTGPHVQLVLMALGPGEEIGLETHADVDQFIRVEAGHGTALLDGKEHALEDGSAVVVPAGTSHNVINRSRTEALKLYSATKAEADAYEREHHR